MYQCRATSATTHVVLGQFKTCVILLGGYLVFNSDPGIVSIGGATVALSGMTVYTTLNLQESQENTSKQLPKQVPPSPKAKPAGEDSKDLNVNSTNNNFAV